MHLLDYAIVFALGAGAMALIDHFRTAARTQGAPQIPTTLEGFGQILTHGEQALVGRLDKLEASIHPDQLIERLKTFMSQEFQAAFAAYQSAVAADTANKVAAAVAAKAAELQPQVDAATAAGAQAESADNTAAVNAALAALQAQPAPQG